MAKSNPVVFQLSSPAMLAFPNLFVPRKFSQGGKEQGEPKFDATFMFRPDHPDLPGLKEKLKEAALQKWPGGVPQPFEWPLKDGGALADKGKAKNKDREFFRGFLVLSSRSLFPPGLSAVLNGRIKDFPMQGDDRAVAEGYFYGGVEVLGQFNFDPYEVGSNTPGVTAYLQVVLSLNRGERRPDLEGGGKSGASVFGAHIGQIVGGDPTAAAGSIDMGLPV